VQIPKKVYEAEELFDESAEPGTGESAATAPDDDYGFMDPSLDEREAPAEPERKPCPVCGEMILLNAAKCRHCGEVLNKKLKKAKKKKPSGGGILSDDDDELSVLEWVVAVFCPLVACI
jgi:hypothetical protein